MYRTSKLAALLVLGAIGAASAQNYGSPPGSVVGGLTPITGVTSGDLLVGTGGVIGDSQIPVGSSTFTSPVIFTGITTPNLAAGNLIVGGLMNMPIFGANGEGVLEISSLNGLVLQGQGSTNDIVLMNKNGGIGCSLLTASGSFSCNNFTPLGSSLAGSRLYLPLTNVPGISANGVAAQNWSSVGTSMFVPVFMSGTTSGGTANALCISLSTSAVTYDTIGSCSVSDERVKNIEKPIDHALAKLLSIEGFYFTYKDPALYGRGRQVGVGAQTVEKVFPELVETNNNGLKGVAYEKLTAPIIEAIRDLKHDNDKLRACLDSWKCRIFGWK